MYLVVKKFIDKDSDKEYPVDSIYRSNNEKRIEHLRELGFIGEELIIKVIPEKETPIEESEKKASKEK